MASPRPVKMWSGYTTRTLWLFSHSDHGFRYYHELTLKIPNISTFRPQPRHQYVAEAHPQYEWIEHIYLGTVTPIDNDFALLEADEEQDRFVLSNQIKELNKAFDRDVVLLQQGVMAQWDGDGLEETMKQDEWEARLLRKVSNMDFT